MLLDPDEKVEPLPVHTLINKAPRKKLWSNLIPPVVAAEEGVAAPVKAGSAPSAELSLPPSEEGTRAVQNKVQKRVKRDSDTDAVTKPVKSGSQERQDRVVTGSREVPELAKIRDVLFPLSNRETNAFPSLPMHFSRLSRTKLRVLAYIYDLCRSNDNGVSPPLTHRYIAEALNMPFETVRTSFRRLCADQLLELLGQHRGPNACHSYRLTNEFFGALKLSLNHQMLVAAIEPSPAIGPHVHSTYTGRKQFESGSGVGQMTSSSSSYLRTTTTNGDATMLEETLLDQLSLLDLKRWGIMARHLLPYIGKGRICETFEDVEELFHRAEAAVDLSEKNGKPIRSRAAFLMSRLKGEPIGVPDGYVSLKEKRLLAEKESRVQELQRIKQAKKEKLLVEFEIFRERVSTEEKNLLVERLRSEESKKLGGIVGPGTLERSVQGRFREEMIKRFSEQYALTGEALEIERALMEQAAPSA